jgi:hypothetical protein
MKSLRQCLTLSRCASEVRRSLWGDRDWEGKTARDGAEPGVLLNEPALEYGVIDLDEGDWSRQPQHVKDGSRTDWSAVLQGLGLDAIPVQGDPSLAGGRSRRSDDKGS